MFYAEPAPAVSVLLLDDDGFDPDELPPPEACAFDWVAEFLHGFVAAPSAT